MKVQSAENEKCGNIQQTVWMHNVWAARESTSKTLGTHLSTFQCICVSNIFCNTFFRTFWMTLFTDLNVLTNCIGGWGGICSPSSFVFDSDFFHFLQKQSLSLHFTLLQSLVSYFYKIYVLEIWPNLNSDITITKFPNEIQMYLCHSVLLLHLRDLKWNWSWIVRITSSLSLNDIRMNAILRFAPKSESESLFNLSESAPF